MDRDDLPDTAMASGSDAGEPGEHLGPADLGPDERRACYEQAIVLGRFDIASLKAAGAGPAAGEASRAGPVRKVSSLMRSTERDGTP